MCQAPCRVLTSIISFSLLSNPGSRWMKKSELEKFKSLAQGHNEETQPQHPRPTGHYSRHRPPQTSLLCPSLLTQGEQSPGWPGSSGTQAAGSADGPLRHRWSWVSQQEGLGGWGPTRPSGPSVPLRGPSSPGPAVAQGGPGLTPSHDADSGSGICVNHRE